MNAIPTRSCCTAGRNTSTREAWEDMQRRDGNGVTFDDSIDHCDVCAVGKSHQLAYPKKAKHADITAPFQLVYGDLMGPFKPAARGGYEYMSKITDQFTKWTAVYLLCTKDQALVSLQLFDTSTVIPFGSRIVTWRADRGGEYTGEDFKAYCQETGITQQFAATNTPQQIGLSGCVGRTLCAMVRCRRVDSGLPPFLWGELMMVASYICNRIPHSPLNMETPYKKLYGKDADLSHLKIIASKTQTTTRRGKGWCAASAGPRATPIVSETQKRVAWWRAGTSFSSKHHQICFPRPGGSRRNKISSHRRTISATTRSTTTTSRTTTTTSRTTTTTSRTTTTTSRTTTCCGTYRTTSLLWISASTRLSKR